MHVFLIGNDMFLFGNDMYMFLVGNEMFLYKEIGLKSNNFNRLPGTPKLHYHCVLHGLCSKSFREAFLRHALLASGVNL